MPNDYEYTIRALEYFAKHASADTLRDFAKQATREELIAFCVWNDRNGCYTDDECMHEFGSTMNTDAYRTIVRDWAKDW